MKKIKVGIIGMGYIGESHIEEIAKAYNVDTVSQIPINHKLAAAVDAGAVELFEGDWLDNVADKLLNLL